MSNTDFDDLLSDEVGKIKAPPVLPGGTWEFQITNGKFVKGREGDKQPLAVAQFMVKPVAPGDDVSEVELEGFGPEQMAEVKHFHKVNIWEKGDRFNVIRFLTQIGFDVENSDLKLDKACAATKGIHFKGYVTHRVNKEDPERPYLDIKNIEAIH